MNEHQHQPRLYISKYTNMYVLICDACGYVLWEQTEHDQCKLPGSGEIRVDVQDGLGLGERLG